MNLKTASAGGGLLMAIVVGASAFFAGEQAKPLENVAEPAFEVAFAPASICPAGWKDTSSTAEEHLKVLSCSRDGWLVILTPEGKFDHGWDGVSPTFEFDESKVPGW